MKLLPCSQNAFVRRPVDLCLTLLYWVYFTLGFIVFFAPRYLFATGFAKDRPRAFQRLNHLFYRGFFFLVKSSAPGVSMLIPEPVRAIRSAVIISNHISYLDPILFISLFKRHKTIVKATFFKVPLFGWVLRQTGYLPSHLGGDFSSLMIDQMAGMQRFLASGGNVFIFPEGTRSRDGGIKGFNTGFLKIARHCKAPVKVLYIRNTDRLFSPGRFLFNTCEPNRITVQLIGELSPEELGARADAAAISEKLRTLMRAQGQGEGM